MKKAAMVTRVRKEGIQVGYDMSMRCRLVRPLAMQSMIVAMQLQVLPTVTSIINFKLQLGFDIFNKCMT